jgi:hypothetical protein
MFVLEEIGIDERCNSAAQCLILFEVSCFDDLEPDVEILIANEKRWILLIAMA